MKLENMIDAPHHIDLLLLSIYDVSNFKNGIRRV